MIAGLGGTAFDGILDQYRFLEEAPIRDLESQLFSVNNRISLFDQLKTSLTALNTLVNDFGVLGSESALNSKLASSSDESVLTVTAENSAINAPHTVSVSQLAKADQVVSGQFSLAGTDLAASLGSGTQTFEITVDGTTSSVSIEVDAADTNEGIYDKVVSAVNSKFDVGISASILKDSETTGRLVFMSEDTGADFEMSLSDTAGSLLGTLGLNDSVQSSGTGGGYIHDSAELNAMAVIDGIAIQSNSNVLDDVLEGLTITLQKTQEAGEQPVTVNVNNDTEDITESVEEFVDAYNAVLSFINTNTAVNTETFQRSEFSGDFSIINLKFDLRSAMSAPITGLNSGDPNILSDLGITMETNGTMTISDSTKLEDMLAGDIEKVTQMFNSSDGFTTRLNSLIENMTDGDGLIELRKDALQTTISTLNSRIDRTQVSVDRRIEFYADQFAQLQAAFAQFQAQSSFIAQFSATSFA